jgi:hypothetical protein
MNIGSFGYGHPIETWTPVISAEVGVDASTLYECNYQKVGPAVLFWGKIDLDLTNGVAYSFDLTLPISAVFTTDTDAVGHLSLTGNVPSPSGGIIANTANNKLLVSGRGTSNTNLTYYFHGMYKRI